MINVVCHYFGELGVQRLGRNLVTALSRREEIALLPVERGWLYERMAEPTRTFLRNARGDLTGNVGLSIGAADLTQRIVGQPRIAHVVWESTRIPEPFLERLGNADELWTPSTWGRRILVDNGFAENRLHVVPEGVDVARFSPGKSEGGVKAVNRPFRFLCVGKWEVRKGIEVLVRAFVAAFHHSEPVELILHCHNPLRPGFSARTALEQLDPSPRARIRISKPARLDALVDLYRSCGAFVLPTRGEGWGLPIVEAMACAKPAIVTDYSAHRDYVSEENGYLVRVEKFVAVEDADCFDPKLDFGEWAQPDEGHLAALMRHVFENQDEARAKGYVARRNVEDSWTWDHAAEKASARLRHIRQAA